MNVFKKVARIAACATVFMASLSAHAGLISVSGGSSYGIASNNNVLSPSRTNATSYNIGGNLSLSQAANLNYTYLGYEAGYLNKLKVDKKFVLSNRDTVGSVYETTGKAGLMDFSFTATNINKGIKNGGNQPYDSFQSFAVLLDVMFDGVFYDAIIAFDDSGAGPDDNHDDMVVGIKATAVPEPTTLALLGLGLVGFGFRRKQA